MSTDLMPSRNGGLDLWETLLSRATTQDIEPPILALLKSFLVKGCTSDKIDLTLGRPADSGQIDSAKELIAKSAEGLLGRAPEIFISTIVEPDISTHSTTEEPFVIPTPQLNENYVFESFVIGPSNRFAHAAAVAVSETAMSETQEMAYNPLFIHSASGMGKSHLLQATCKKILAQNPNTILGYISCEDFQNMFFTALQHGDLDSFRQRFRKADVLVVDDIHFLANRESTQEEIFYTFNTLYNASKQIILSSDCSPREIQGLEDRLVSRFKWGLVAEIEPPTYETRLEIIRVKSASRGFDMPKDVSEFIAEQSNTNIRELEGALLKIIGYSSLLGTPVDLNLAQEVLASPTTKKRSSRPLSAEDIINEVCHYYRVDTEELQSKGRARSVALPRQVAMYLIRELTRHSLEAIGGFFGGRDHSTVKHGCDKISEQVANGGEVIHAVRSLRQKIMSL